MKGKILGSRYQVIEYIAEGGFGRTYLAQDTQLPDRDLCVVKQLSPSFNAPNLLKIARRLFKTEAAALHSLGHHPQIPELLAYFEEAGKFYLVQQYIKGQTLDRELVKASVWSSEQTIELLRDCLHVLQFIHEKGVIHRDLKPANLIRRQSDKKIVIVDFGTVKNVLQGQNELAQLTVAVGTQGYMPIEQAKGKPRSTSDLYALGIICIQALTGVDPLELEEDRHGEIAWLHLANAEPDLSSILTKMTRYSAQDRYQSAGLVLNALNDNLDTIVTPPQTAIASSPPPRSEIPAVVQSARYISSPNADPKALPGIRSVAMMRDRPKPAKTKLTSKNLWKLVLGIIVVSGGVYFSLQAFVFKTENIPTNSESKIER